MTGLPVGISVPGSSPSIHAMFFNTSISSASNSSLTLTVKVIVMSSPASISNGNPSIKSCRSFVSPSTNMVSSVIGTMYGSKSESVSLTRIPNFTTSPVFSMVIV